MKSSILPFGCSEGLLVRDPIHWMKGVAPEDVVCVCCMGVQPAEDDVNPGQWRTRGVLQSQVEFKLSMVSLRFIGLHRTEDGWMFDELWATGRPFDDLWFPITRWDVIEDLILPELDPLAFKWWEARLKEEEEDRAAEAAGLDAPTSDSCRCCPSLSEGLTEKEKNPV